MAIPRKYAVPFDVQEYIRNGLGQDAPGAVAAPAAPAAAVPMPVAAQAPAQPLTPEEARLLARLRGAPLGSPAPFQPPPAASRPAAPVAQGYAPAPQQQPAQQPPARQQAEPMAPVEQAPERPIGEVALGSIGGFAGNLADALSWMSRSGARPQGLGNRGYAIADAALQRYRDDTADWQLRAQKQAEKAKAEQFDDPASPQSRAAQARYGALLESAGLDPSVYSARQISEMMKDPLKVGTTARKIDADKQAAERQAQQDAVSNQQRAYESQKTDATSALSNRTRASLRNLMQSLRMDPSIVTDDMTHADLTDPNGAVQSALGERRALASGGIRPGTGGGLSAPQGVPISTDAGDIASPADAIAASVKAAFPRGAEPENLDARIRQIMAIKDESQRDRAIAALEREGERYSKRLEEYGSKVGDEYELNAAIDEVGSFLQKYQGKDLPGSGIQALPTLIAQSLPVIGGEGSAAETVTKNLTLGKEGQKQMQLQGLLEEVWGRARSGATIGEVEGAKFKVQAALAKGATDEQIREGFSALKQLQESKMRRFRAANPEGAALYERNLAAQKQGTGGDKPALPGVEWD